MQREVIQTADGSNTIRIIELDENYHSSHGALQEANHVFIKNGLFEFADKLEIDIFEMGFGTGLNAFLSAINACQLNVKVNYVGVEAFPVSMIELNRLKYADLEGNEYSDLYNNIHGSSWNEKHQLTDTFSMKKIHQKLEEIEIANNSFDIVYYDAFGPRAQEEMWTVELFQKMYNAIKPSGFLVTYCAKGQVKRNLKEIGFTIEVLPGPPGKREMTRAWKNEF